MRAVDGEDGVYEFSFSSETPVRRWWGNEVLGHDTGEPKLERLKTVWHNGQTKCISAKRRCY